MEEPMSPMSPMLRRFPAPGGIRGVTRERARSLSTSAVPRFSSQALRTGASPLKRSAGPPAPPGAGGSCARDESGPRMAAAGPKMKLRSKDDLAKGPTLRRRETASAAPTLSLAPKLATAAVAVVAAQPEQTKEPAEPEAEPEEAVAKVEADNQPDEEETTIVPRLAPVFAKPLLKLRGPRSAHPEGSILGDGPFMELIWAPLGSVDKSDEEEARRIHEELGGLLSIASE